MDEYTLKVLQDFLYTDNTDITDSQGENDLKIPCSPFDPCTKEAYLWQVKRELRSFTDLAFHFNFPAMCFYNIIAER